MRRLSNREKILCICFGIFVADQLTKYLVHDYYNLDEANSYEVIRGFLKIHHAHNFGAIGGLLSGNNWLLTLFSVAALTMLIAFRRSFVTSHKEHLLALGLIAGGILGNLADRVARGCVEDFLILFLGDIQVTYVFNIADMGICVGVAVYIIALLLPRKKESPATAKDGASQEKVEQPK